MKKRVISLVLALTLALGLTLPAGAAGRETAEPGTPLAAEEGVSAFIAGDGALYTCGLNLGYQLGYEQTNGSTTIAGIGTADKEAGLQNKFAKVMDDVVAVDFGWNQAAAIKSDGSLWMWGSAYAGQLGFKASGDYQTTPRKVMDGVAQVSCGGNFTAAVKTDGSLWTWGYGYDGRLGNGNTGDTGNPQHIMDDVVQVSCGVDYAAAIKSDGSLWTWGSNRVGQLGFEPVTSGTGLFASTEPQLTPKKILSSGAAYIECGNSAMALIKTDGSLWTWGENSEGVLGNGTQKDTWEHQHILDDVVQVALTLSPCSTAYAIQSDGSLWAWGSNNSNYAGFEGGNATNGGWPVQTVPKKILDRAVRVATGGMHTIALMDDGTLWAWGYNNNGVQGRGSNLPICYSPSKVLDNMLNASGTEETPSAPVAGFSDVRTSDYFADAVAWAAEKGVTTGTSATAFSPKDTVTRAEAVTFLWRAAGRPEPVSAVSSFSDVTDQNAYYYKAVLWAVEQGITNGTGGGRFDLTGTLTYDQIFTMLGRAAGVSLSGSDWSSAAVSWASGSGLTDGLSFSAKAACPRADVIYCLWKQMA